MRDRHREENEMGILSYISNYKEINGEKNHFKIILINTDKTFSYHIEMRANNSQLLPIFVMLHNYFYTSR